MKKPAIIITICLLCFTLFPIKSSAIKINLHGNAGASYQNGKWKVCPKFRFNVCATIDVSWKEVIDFIFGSDQQPEAIVEVYDEEGNPDYSISVRIVGINNGATSGTSPPNYIMGDDLELEQN